MFVPSMGVKTDPSKLSLGITSKSKGKKSHSVISIPITMSYKQLPPDPQPKGKMPPQIKIKNVDDDRRI